MYPPAILRLGSTSQSMRRHLFSIICSFSWGSRGGDANPFHSGHSSTFLPASVTPSREFLLRLFNPFLLSLSPLPPSFLPSLLSLPIRPSDLFRRFFQQTPLVLPLSTLLFVPSPLPLLFCFVDSISGKGTITAINSKCRLPLLWVTSSRVPRTVMTKVRAFVPSFCRCS